MFKSQIWIINLALKWVFKPNIYHYDSFIWFSYLYSPNLFIHLIITISDRIKTSNNENNKLIFLSPPFFLIACSFGPRNHD